MFIQVYAADAVQCNQALQQEENREYYQDWVCSADEGNTNDNNSWINGISYDDMPHLMSAWQNKAQNIEIIQSCVSTINTFDRFHSNWSDYYSKGKELLQKHENRCINEVIEALTKKQLELNEIFRKKVAIDAQIKKNRALQYKTQELQYKQCLDNYHRSSSYLSWQRTRINFLAQRKQNCLNNGYDSLDCYVWSKRDEAGYDIEHQQPKSNCIQGTPE